MVREPTSVDPLEESDCIVCQEGISEDTNQIVFCDGTVSRVTPLTPLGCEIAVHQDCYGIRLIPEGSWNCTACAELGPGKSPNLTCPLCNNTGGAFKKDDTGDWIHVQCAVYVLQLSHICLSLLSHSASAT